MSLNMAATQFENGPSQTTMKNQNLESMSTDKLWQLHELLVAELTRKIGAERDQLEGRLRRLGAGDGGIRRKRNPYPKVLPKYRNPKNRGETWAGRGKLPRWLATQLEAGKRLSEFLIR